MTKARKLRSRKAGLPPGSLVHIGEVKTATPTVTLIDYDTDKLSETTLPDISSLAARGKSHGIRWANFYGIKDPADLLAVARQFDLHPLVQEDILNNAQRQKIDAYDDYLYVVLHRYELGGRTLELVQDQISLIIGRQSLLSFQERPSRTFEPVRQSLRSERSSLRRSGVDMLAYSLLDAVVDSYFAIIEQLNEHAETLEQQILGRPKPSALQGIHQLKRCVSQLRRNLYPLREVVANLNRDSTGFFSADVRLYLRDVYDHIVHILESLEDLRELATGLLDVYLSTVSHRVNLEVRALTVVATVFMPATLIAGIFGMNFREMPWLADAGGFYYAIALMGLIAGCMLFIIWQRKRKN